MFITDLEYITSCINVIGLLETEGATHDMLGSRDNMIGHFSIANEFLEENSTYKNFFKSQYEYQVIWDLVMAIRFIATGKK